MNRLPKGKAMRTPAAVGICLIVLGAGVIGARGAGLVSPASAAGAAVTPKTEAPNEARALSRAFSAVAKALGPSVVRIEVEVGGGPRMSERRGRRGAPSPDDNDNDNSDIPPFFRHFFE